jgi:hypothetical protein
MRCSFSESVALGGILHRTETRERNCEPSGLDLSVLTLSTSANEHKAVSNSKRLKAACDPKLPLAVQQASFVGLC